MKSTCFFFFISLLFSLQSLAQNLVLNGSFEELGNLPVRPNVNNSYEYEPRSGYKPFQKNLKYWYAGTMTTPDLRITDSQRYSYCQKRFDDCDKARTGDNTIGIITYMKNPKTETYREYCQTKLRSILQPNVKTYIELWVRKERQAKLVSNNIGIHFSYHEIKKATDGIMELLPQFNHSTIINETGSEWIKMEGHFIPEQPFRYITIGNFFPNEDTQTAEYTDYTGSPYTPPYAYYLIDDIRIWQEGDVPEPPVFENKKVADNEPITLRYITFETNSAELKNASYQELDKLYNFLIKYPDLKIAIHGHTDDVGTNEDNFKLSNARAKAVFDFLIKKNIVAERLSYQGFGESKPIASNEEEVGRMENRRVEFVVVKE